MAANLRAWPSDAFLDRILVIGVFGALLVINVRCAAPAVWNKFCEWLKTSRTLGIKQAALLLCDKSLRYACVCLWADTQSKKDLVDQHINHQMNMLRLDGMKLLVVRAQRLLFIITASCFYNTLSHNPRTNTRSQDALIAVAHTLLLLLSYRPRLLNLWTTNVWYSFMMLLVATTLPLAHEDHISIYLILVMGAQIMISSANLNFKFYAFWNLFVCFVFALWTAVARDFTLAISNQLLSFALCVLILISSLRSMELHMEQQVRYRVDATEARNEHSAAHAVLSTVCDVVVELDEELQLMEHSPKLAAMLFLAPLRDLKGTKLQALIPQAHDQEVFEKHMKRRGSDDERGMADTFHLHMCDADQNAVAMELFSVQFDALDQQVRYMIGIREWTDAPPFAVVPDASSRARTQPYSNIPSIPETLNTAPVNGANYGVGSDRSLPESDGLLSRRPPQPWLDRNVTTSKAKQYTLLSTRSCWNAGNISWDATTEGRCCLYHAILQETFKEAAQLQESPCILKARHNSWPQRPTYGNMAADLSDTQAGRCSVSKPTAPGGYYYKSDSSHAEDSDTDASSVTPITLPVAAYDSFYTPVDRVQDTALESSWMLSTLKFQLAISDRLSL